MRILIVEDQVCAREALQSLLEDDGYEVLTAASVTEATVVIRSEDFDTALLDLKLPDGDGRTLVAIVRESHPSSKIFLATGSSALETKDDMIQFEDTEALARELGADGYVSKPIDYDNLLQLLQA